MNSTHLLAAILGLGTLASAASCDDKESCSEGVQGDRLTLDLGQVCLAGIEARALVGGEWQAAELALVSGVEQSLVLSVEGPAEAFELVLPGIKADRMLQQGYQSWSFSGVVKLVSEPSRASDGAQAFAAASTGDVTDEERGVSYGSALLGQASGPFVLVGAASSNRANTGIAAWVEQGATQVHVVYGTARETLAPDQDGRSRSEPIVLLADREENLALDRYRASLQEHLLPDAHVPIKPPGGWFSWNERYDDIDSAFIRDHIAIIKDELLPRGMPLVEIDDGWMPSWGDWISNERFESVEDLGTEVRDAGLVAGIWLAPFLVDVESERARTMDPGLLVLDEEGQPIVHRPTAATTSYYVLDGSNPESMAQVVSDVARLQTAGYRFFKFDYLYAGALPGLRSLPVTGVQAMRSGLEKLRAAIGEDAIMNACGVPIHPVLGLADSVRIGPDTAFQGFDLALPLLASAARSYAARAYLFPIFWPDSDQTQVRSGYELALAEMSPVIAAMAGPAYALGDDLSGLDADRRALALSELIMDLAASTQPARPIDLMAEMANNVIVSPSLETAITSTYTRAPPPARFSATGASGTSYEIEFNWLPPYGVVVR